MFVRRRELHLLLLRSGQTVWLVIPDLFGFFGFLMKVNYEIMFIGRIPQTGLIDFFRAALNVWLCPVSLCSTYISEE